MFFTLCLCTIMLSLPACGGKSGEGLIGKWEQKINEEGGTAVSTYTFKENGELVQTLKIKSPDVNIQGEGTCDYQYNGTTITFKFSASDFDFTKFEVKGISKSDLAAGMEMMRRQMVDMIQEFTDVKISGNTLTAMFNGQKVTLKRI